MGFGISLLSGDGRAPAGSPTAAGSGLRTGGTTLEVLLPYDGTKGCTYTLCSFSCISNCSERGGFSQELLCQVTIFHDHGCKRRWGFTPDPELNRGIPLKRNWLLRKYNSQLTFSSIHSSLTVFEVDYVNFQADTDYFSQQKCGTSTLHCAWDCCAQ